MRAYGSMMKTRFLNDLQYRTAAVSGIVTQLFFGLIQILTLYAFYREHPSGRRWHFNRPFRTSGCGRRFWPFL